MSVDFNPSNLRRKSILRDTSGNIINWLDEAGGGWIVRNRQVVNADKWNAILKAEEDKKIAIQAASQAVSASPQSEALRSGKPLQEIRENPLPVVKPVVEKKKRVSKKEKSKVDELEKKVNSMDDKLNAILKALNKNG